MSDTTPQAALPLARDFLMASRLLELIARPSRLALLILPLDGERTPSGLADALGLSRSDVSHQPRPLGQAGLVEWRARITSGGGGTA